MALEASAEEDVPTLVAADVATELEETPALEVPPDALEPVPLDGVTPEEVTALPLEEEAAPEELLLEEDSEPVPLELHEAPPTSITRVNNPSRLMGHTSTRNGWREPTARLRRA